MIRLPVRRAWPLPPNTLAGVMDGKRSRIVRRILFSLSPLTVSMSRPRKREMLPRRTSQSIIHGEKWRPDHGMTDMGLESFRSLCVRPNSDDTLFESISVSLHFLQANVDGPLMLTNRYRMVHVPLQYYCSTGIDHRDCMRNHKALSCQEPGHGDR